jgi:beta-lactamase regulating signal transducer with metallopeptidase domain
MNWLHYLLEANIYLAVFYAGYCLFLNKETHYTLNRVYLLLSCIISFILPVVQIGALKSTNGAAQQTYVTTASVVSNVVASPVLNYKPETTPVTLQEVIWYVYLAGIAVLSLMLIIKIVRLIKMTANAKTLAGDEYKLVGLKDSNTAFSFFNYLFIGTKTAGSHLIIQHELVHIRQKHSADILFIELLRIINWFNPIIYLIQLSVKTVHEYIADEQTAAQGTDALTYSSFLVDNAYGINGPSITHSFFNYNLLKKRIIMLNQKRSGNLARLKYLVAVPICAGLLCASTLAFSKNYAMVDLAPKHNQPTLAAFPDSGQKAKPQNTPQLLPPPPPPIVVKDTYTDLFNYLNKTIVYPANALKTGKAGLVGVSFEVKADQQITNIKIVKNASTEFSDEVLRAIKSYTGAVKETAGTHKMTVYFCTDYYKFVKTPDAKELQAPGYDFNMLIFGASKYPAMAPNADKKAVNLPAPVQINDATKLPPPPAPAPPVSMQADTPIRTTTDAFYKYMAKTVRYPAAEHDKHIGGRVIVAFDVVDGKITDPKVVRTLTPAMDGEVLRSVKAFDGTLDLKPGYYSMPLSFTLLDSKDNQIAHLPEAAATDNQTSTTGNHIKSKPSISLNEIAVVGYPYKQ